MDALEPREQLLFGVATLVLVAGLFMFGVHIALGAFAGGYELQAEFSRTGQGLTNFSSVRMRGITVGTVTRVDVNDHGRAVVTMRINDGVDISDDVEIRVGALSVFGPKIIDLVPGGKELTGPFLEPGTLVAFDRTTAPTDLEGMLITTDEILAGIDLEALHTSITTIADIFDGQGATFGSMLDHSAALVDLADRNTDNARQMISDLARLAAMVQPRGGALISGLGNANLIMGDLNARAEVFDELLAATSEVSREITRLLDDHRDDFHLLLDGLAQGTLPALRSVTAEAQNLPVFGDAIGGFTRLLGDIMQFIDTDGALNAVVEIHLNVTDGVLCDQLSIC